MSSMPHNLFTPNTKDTISTYIIMCRVRGYSKCVQLLCQLSMSNDDDILMSSADGGHVLKSEGARKLDDN